ncbi:MAG: L-2-amino-thiazoline-4-carboxylic acid hydrolase [Defluviitaleaceae bacterium]|nr:L-2-amino-thiazoline-4-carboxylic acid hydrolase [Defluviitaleaceae bacterium]
MSMELTAEQEKQVQERVQEQTSHIWEMVDCGMANVLKIMTAHYGEEACQVYVKANSQRVMQRWRKKAEEVGDNSIESLIKHLWEPLLAKGYEYTMEKTEMGTQMRCTKCPAVAPAKRHGIAEQMFYMCCENDRFIAEGFNPNIGLKLTKTLMQGDDCCNHFYYYKDKSK